MAESEHRPRGRVGTTVRGKYRVDAFLATGTMANVYAATHRNGSRVALKVLHREYAFEPRLTERFKREGYFANSIGHPGVIRAIDDDLTEDGCPFLVMELLEGETLEQRRQRKGGKLAMLEALGIIDAVLDVLSAAHEKHVLHRDMKPDNVFLTNSGELKLLDFGVARYDDGLSSSDMTGVGMVLGTPAFMPPEQALGRREDVDARSDLWAVGAMLFVMLTGEPVHAGADAKQKLIATARTPARPLQEVDPSIPRAVATVIDRALAFDRDARWPDAYAMREALRWARMSVEPTTSRAGRIPTITNEVPAPVPTKRNFDDEQTVARRYPSEDVVTSAPALAPAAAPASAASSGPVFSLRRGRDDDEQPDTERFDRPIEPAPSPPPQQAAVGMSFTRPMAAIVMPEAPAPNAEAQRGNDFETPLGGQPAAQPVAAPSLANADIRKTLPFGIFANTPAPVVMQTSPEAFEPAKPPAAPVFLSMPPPPQKAGPMVAEVTEARSRGQGLRVFAIVALAAALMGGAYFFMVKRRPTSPTPVATVEPAKIVPPAVSVAAAPPPSAAPSEPAAPPPSAAPPEPVASAPPAVTVAAAEPKPVVHRARPRPKPRPAEPAASASPDAPTAPATAIEPPAEKPADPPPAETPKPASSLPGDSLF